MNKRETFWELVGVVDDAISEMRVDMGRSAGRVMVDVHTGDWRRRLRAWWDGARQTSGERLAGFEREDAERRSQDRLVSLVGRQVNVDGVGICQVEGPVYGLPGWFVVLMAGERRAVRGSQIWMTLS